MNDTPADLTAGPLADQLRAVDPSLVVVTSPQAYGITAVRVGTIGSDDTGKPVAGVTLWLNPLHPEDHAEQSRITEAVEDYIERGGGVDALLQWLDAQP